MKKQRVMKTSGTLYALLIGAADDYCQVAVCNKESNFQFRQYPQQINAADKATDFIVGLQ